MSMIHLVRQKAISNGRTKTKTATTVKKFICISFSEVAAILPTDSWMDVDFRTPLKSAIFCQTNTLFLYASAIIIIINVLLKIFTLNRI